VNLRLPIPAAVARFALSTTGIEVLDPTRAWGAATTLAKANVFDANRCSLDPGPLGPEATGRR
jgi:hypothetical protein